MVRVCVNKNNYLGFNCINPKEVFENVSKVTNLRKTDFFLEANGKRLDASCDSIDANSVIYLRLTVCGGKGGFGSMLRAIGAQIEKTTNREACRDLSGRRLRDINEEKRLKAWLEKQSEREREAEERKKKKIEKLLTVPKHEFKDEQYEEARSKLTEKVNDAVEEGFKKAMNIKGEQNDLKRKAETNDKATKRKKAALWIDDDLSDTDTDDESEQELEERKTLEA